MFECFAARHLQDIVDGPAVVSHGECVFVVATALACLALDPNVRQEVHLDADLPVAETFFAASARDVEAESASSKAADLCVGQLREQLSNQIKRARVGCRV